MPIGNISEWSAAISFTTSYTSNHEELGLSRLLEQYKGQPNIEALVKSYITNQIQPLEDALIQLTTVFDRDASEGVQLDRIGEHVGQPRQGFSDAKYRRSLNAKIGQNVSQGDIERIIAIWLSLTGGTMVAVVELFPASVTLYSDVEVPGDEITLLANFINDALPAAVGLDGFGVIPDVDTFGFSPNSKGFSSDGSTGGGPFYQKQFGS